MFDIILSKKVEKFLDEQDDKFIKSFYKISIQIAKNPFERDKTIDIKNLKGKEKLHFRLRVRKTRFLYKVNIKKNILLFYKAGFRGDIYKN